MSLESAQKGNSHRPQCLVWTGGMYFESDFEEKMKSDL